VVAEATEGAVDEAAAAAVGDVVVVAVDVAEDSRCDGRASAKIDAARDKETERRLRRGSGALRHVEAQGTWVAHRLERPEKKRLRFTWNGHRVQNISSMHGVRQIWEYV